MTRVNLKQKSRDAHLVLELALTQFFDTIIINKQHYCKHGQQHTNMWRINFPTLITVPETNAQHYWETDNHWPLE